RPFARHACKRDGNRDQPQGRNGVDGHLELALALIEQQQDGRRDERQDDWRNDEMCFPVQQQFSLPSTWSVRVNPREASSTTRKSAVIAKPMTMAVRTSACGTGSVYCVA